MTPEQVLRRLGTLEAEPPETPCLDEEAIRAYRNGGLENDARLEAEAHLSQCAYCRDILVAMDTEPRRLSDAKVDAILEAVKPVRAIPRHRPILRVVAGGLAAAAALFIVAKFPQGEVPVPPYHIQLEGAVSHNRGADGHASTDAYAVQHDDPGALLYVPWSQVILRLEPDRGIPSSMPQVALYEKNAEGRWRRLSGFEVRSEEGTGSIELRADAQSLFGTRFGLKHVRILLIPEGETPPDNPDVIPPGSQVMDRQIVYQPSEPL